MKSREEIVAQPPVELGRFYADMYYLGSLDQVEDLQAVMSQGNLRHILAEEAYRLLMEPVARFQEEGAEVAATIFRPMRDLKASEVYNWMLHFKCLDVDYDEYKDVACVLDPENHGNWRIHDSTLRGSRLFLTLNKDRLFQEGCCGGEPLALEYVTIPDSLLSTDVIRTGYTSQTVLASDLVIAWNFPEDPVRPWHR